MNDLYADTAAMIKKEHEVTRRAIIEVSVPKVLFLGCSAYDRKSTERD
jgi:hypothetical protein